MCPDTSNRDRELPTHGENPLYDYLLDLQEKRIRLIEALAPRRHLSWQAWVFVSFILLFIIDVIAPPYLLGELPIALIILLGPLFVLSGICLAGWHAQMMAVKNYPSPFDYPRALELLLSTPLTEKEIANATVGAFVRFPFMGMSWKRLLIVAINIALLIFIVLEANRRYALPTEVLSMALKLYLPALCVFIYFPILTALDMLLVPSNWLRRLPDELTSPAESLMGRTGRLPILAMILVLAPLIYRINRYDPLGLDTVRWVLITACPVILLAVGAAVTLLILMLPGHLARVRRG